MEEPVVKSKTIVTYKVRGVAESHWVTALYARDIMDVSDEPVERGGTNIISNWNFSAS